MRIKRLKLTNWRNFTEIDVPLQERTFLVGPNASGKSNFLDALRFLGEVAEFGLSQSVARRGGLKAIRCLAARKVTHVAVELTACTDSPHVEWTYRLVFNLTRSGRRQLVVKEETVRHQGRKLLRRPDSKDEQDPDLLTQTHLEQVGMNKSFRKLQEALGTIEYLHVVPQLVREPERFLAKGRDPYGSDLLERIYATQAKTRDRRLARVQEVIAIAVPQLRSLEIERDDPTGAVHLIGRYHHWRGIAAKQNESQFSDGTLRLFGLLWALLDSKGPMLLEEPEMSLHPGVVEHIPQMLARLVRERDRQVIMSTHSGELLTDPGIQPSEVLMFIPSEEGTKVVPAIDIQDVAELLQAGITMAEITIERTKPRDARQLALFG